MCTTVTITHTRCYCVNIIHLFHMLIYTESNLLYYVIYHIECILFGQPYFIFLMGVSLAHYSETKCLWKLWLYDRWLNKWFVNRSSESTEKYFKMQNISVLNFDFSLRQGTLQPVPLTHSEKSNVITAEI